jgi:CheY-like chemotaxis protein
MSEEPPLAEQAGAPLRVLVVDDNHDAVASMEILLKYLGAEVAVAYDGLQAMAQFDHCRPALVLLDIGMPGLTGYDVARALRRKHPAHTALIAAVSGWGSEEDRRQGREAGFDHHLVKPADLQALKRLMQQAAERAAGAA